MSTMIHGVIAIAATMMTKVERVKAVVWTALMAPWLKVMKIDHHEEQEEVMLLEVRKKKYCI